MATLPLLLLAARIFAGGALTFPVSQEAMAQAAPEAAATESGWLASREGHATVWIHAFARSGSSTLLSLVSEAGNEGGSRGRAALRSVMQTLPKVDNVFTLFEPCDRRDKLAEEVMGFGFEERCVKLMSNFSNCNFENVIEFHNWLNFHNKRHGAGSVFVQEKAEAACAGADMVVYKTVTRAFEPFRLPEHGMPAVEANPNMLMIDVIRDPRSIFASWMSTWPFNDTNLPAGVRRNMTALTDICDSFAAALTVEHPRLLRVVFEHMVNKPYETHKEISAFLGTPFGDTERDWIASTFNAQACPGVDEFIAPYSDCHTDSKETLQKWRKVLTEEEQQGFLDHPECVAVAEMFNYSL